MILALLLVAAVGVAEREASQPDVSARDGAIHTPDLTVRARDKAGKVQRSATRRAAFLKATGFPKGRPGYVVDHGWPLACGGADIPSNMAWQTVAEAKAKDRWELDCRKWSDGTYLRLLQSAIDAEAARERKRLADIAKNRRRKQGTGAATGAAEAPFHVRPRQSP